MTRLSQRWMRSCKFRNQMERWRKKVENWLGHKPNRLRRWSKNSRLASTFYQEPSCSSGCNKIVKNVIKTKVGVPLEKSRIGVYAEKQIFEDVSSGASLVFFQTREIRVFQRSISFRWCSCRSARGTADRRMKNLLKEKQLITGSNPSRGFIFLLYSNSIRQKSFKMSSLFCHLETYSIPLQSFLTNLMIWRIHNYNTLRMIE